MANRIKVNDYLKNLNNQVKDFYKNNSKPIDVELLDCKKLAARLGVTAATISNLTVDSKYSLIRNIALEIHENYKIFLIRKTEQYLKELQEKDLEIETEFYNMSSVSEIIEDLYNTNYWD